MRRRDFLMECGGAAVFACSDRLSLAALRPLGQTGLSVSGLGLGTGSMHRLNEQSAADLLASLEEIGVNLIDTSPQYGGGLAEERIGRYLANRAVILAGKTLHRTKKEALRDLRESLQRLRRDTLDVWMLHDLRTEPEWELARFAGGFLEAAYEAKKAGMIRAVGISAHRHPALLCQAVLETEIDAVMIPVQPSRFWPEDDSKNLYACLRKKNIGILGFKISASSSDDQKASVDCAVVGWETLELLSNGGIRRLAQSSS